MGLCRPGGGFFLFFQVTIESTLLHCTAVSMVVIHTKMYSQERVRFAVMFESALVCFLVFVFVFLRVY